MLPPAILLHRSKVDFQSDVIRLLTHTIYPPVSDESRETNVSGSTAVTFHDQLASTWEDRYKTRQFSVRLQVLSELLPESQKGKRWLDAGCGTGTLSRWLANERGASVTALDASEQMLANAQGTLGVEYLRGDLTRCGLPDSSIDGILCSSVLEYLADVSAALKEFHRVLRPGGIVLASIPNAALSVRIPLRLGYWMTRWMGQRRLFSFLDHSRHVFTTNGFAQLLRENGFEPEVIRDFGKIRLPIGVDLPIASSLLMGRFTSIRSAHESRVG